MLKRIVKLYIRLFL